jgi:hypothetical protein
MVFTTGLRRRPMTTREIPGRALPTGAAWLQEAEIRKTVVTLWRNGKISLDTAIEIIKMYGYTEGEARSLLK